jgi:hypothetical protein
MWKKRITINEKPLSRKETLSLANKSGILHKPYSKILTEEINGKIITLRQVYELPNSEYLYIRDVNGRYDGKGNIFSKIYFDKFMIKVRRMNEDIKNGRTSNISHWNFYSKNKSKLIERIPELVSKLCEFIEVDDLLFDYSTKSLDTLSTYLKEKNVDNIFEEYYDNLVAYIGETIRKNSKMTANWTLDTYFNFPVISTVEENIFYNPINIIWEELTMSEDINLRKGYGKELRRIGNLISSEKIFKNIKVNNGT